jgi:transcriptional regulator with XRE-family HTH domain
MKQQLKKEIGIRIRKIRKALGYTQVQMVSYFEIGRANYSRLEKGEIFPSATLLNTLRREFQVSLDWLITDEGEMFFSKKQKAELVRRLNAGKYSEEINELLFDMNKIPMIKHAVLEFYLEYKQKNSQIVQQLLEEGTPPAQK